MSEIGILYRRENIRAIAENRKTMTRRVIVPQPSFCFEVPRIIDNEYWELGHWGYCSAETRNIWQPTGRFKLRYQVGDLLYVKTNYFTKKADATLWLRVTEVKDPHRIQDISEENARCEGCGFDGHYFSLDGKASLGSSTAKRWFQKLWDSINAKPKPVYKTIDGKKVITHYVSYPWDDIHETREHRGKPWVVCGNPWVFPYVFERK